MGDLPAVEAALLEWINDFPLPKKVSSTTELGDGLILWDILRTIDPAYFGHRKLPSPDIKDAEYWLPKWQNLKQLNKDLSTYVRDECTQQLSLSEAAMPDLKAIAVVKEGSTVETVKLLKLILMAAVYSPQANEILSKMPSLSFDTQAAIKTVIEEMSAQSNEASGYASPTENRQQEQDTKALTTDPELLFEERFGKVVAENDSLIRDKADLQQEVTDLQTRLARLQDNNQIMQDRLTEAEDKLGVNGSAKKGFGADAEATIRRLEARLQEQEDIIAHDEVKLSEFQTERDEQEKTIEALQSSSGSTQKLQDELDMITIERDGLAKKANTLEKYKQKLAATQNLESENRQLRSEVEDLRQQAQIAAQDRHQSEGLQMTVDQYRQTIAKVEQDYSELQMMKRRLELDNAALTQRMESAAEQQARDLESISDLQDKVRDLESGTMPTVHENGDLEFEMQDGEKSKADLKLEISKLKAEIQQIRAGSKAESENVHLHNMLKDADDKAERLENKYFEAYQAQLLSENQLAALGQGTISKGNELFVKMRTMYDKNEKQLAELGRKLAKAEADCLEIKREYAAAKTDLSMVDKDKIDALTELKQANSTEVVELRHEHKAMSSRNEQLAKDLDEQKSLLNRTLLKLSDQKDRLHETQLSSGDLKATLDVLNAANKGREEGSKDVLEQRIAQLQETVDSNKEALTKRTEHVNRQTETIADLQRQLKKAQEQQSLNNESAKQQELKNLARENALMATAWYDLTSRLQQSGVVPQRRSEARSWLNKQRRLLNTPTRR